MKITEENVNQFKYNEKTGKWYRNNRTYIKIPSCKMCGKEYFSLEYEVKNGRGLYCDGKCKGMHMRRDISGERFNMLTALEFIEINKNGDSVWKCKCDCGNIKNVLLGSLTQELVKSCGCLKTNRKNLVGKRFGKLVVIEFAGVDEFNHSIWLCRCDCGCEKIISINGLISKRTKSCGCLNIEINKKIHNGKNSHLWKGGVTEKNIPLYNTYAHKIDWCEKVRRNPDDENVLQVRCKKCNIWFTPKMTDIIERIKAINGNIKGENNLYCSPECKKECPIFNKQLYQENHPNKPNNIQRPYQTEWSKMVLEGDNYTCQICEATENLVAHHIKPVKTHPHLQADVDNGICLCERCHDKHGHKDECSTGNLAKLVC